MNFEVVLVDMGVALDVVVLLGGRYRVAGYTHRFGSNHGLLMIVWLEGENSIDAAT